MKKNLLNPGFEFVFSLGVIAMLILPSMLLAQQPKNIKVTIQNNDTTVNGKNIKELSATERKRALKDIKEIDNGISITKKGKGQNSVYIFRKKEGDGKDMIVEREMDGKDMPPMAFNFKIDSSDKHFDFHPEEMMKRARDLRFNYNSDDERPRWSIGGSRGRNTQSFSYSSTNNDGISTHVNYNVGDTNKETTKRISGAEKADLAINDLTLTPSFSTGKTNLDFTLAQKGIAEVQFKDSEGKTLWTDKTNGAFSKSFDLPQNGIYYLQVKQGNKLGLRRIVKEQ